MALVVGVPFVWAIYLSFTDAIGGSLTGNWVGFDNFTERRPGRQLPARAFATR